MTHISVGHYGSFFIVCLEILIKKVIGTSYEMFLVVPCQCGDFFYKRN